MSSIHFPIYSLIILLAAAVAIPIMRKNFDGFMKTFIIAALVGAWLFSLGSLINVFNHGPHVYNFGSWTETIGVQLMIDEFSAIMAFVILTIAGLIVVYSIRDMEHEIPLQQFGSYYILVYILLFCMVGITYTNDLFNMYVFMEILSLTSCGIISIKRKKENFLASFRYLMLNTIGSLSVLLGIALLYMVTGHLNMGEVGKVIAEVWQSYPINILVSLGFMITGLSIKAALFPLHIWLPDAHSTAPTPSSALLSGLVVKVYIFCAAKILFRMIGQDIVIALDVPTYITYFAALSMIMGSIFAIGQKDIKRLLAYSSVAQIGYIFLGLGLATAQGFSAALFHIISHALMKTGLFLSAGAIIYNKGKRDIRELDGIGYEMPITMGVFTISVLGMIGIPGINGFMSKIYLSFAVLAADKPFFLFVILASSFLNAIYYLPIVIAAFLKESKERKNIMVLDAIPKSMIFPMVVIGVSCVIMGLFPQLVMNAIEQVAPTFLTLN
ncbi:multisubunit sodium/proton antiporter, MrpD subunit [Natronincola peptidivorans]|uniref:Multisubunit sodium/proton antiporter, MrpD subunit n=1 Tax=Natronincola peptidivorans TaxID=426128 RepID=A0A1I0BIM8_9FIRM|nr:monovalent cation/H+ antiporter subunit D family protein [Natronincola peptidivorans]SET06686.1 multisubunit sodium/proton antiporter, MrpD subunit [Natronincola peptidivorans]